MGVAVTLKNPRASRKKSKKWKCRIHRHQNAIKWLMNSKQKGCGKKNIVNVPKETEHVEFPVDGNSNFLQIDYQDEGNHSSHQLEDSFRLHLSVSEVPDEGSSDIEGTLPLPSDSEPTRIEEVAHSNGLPCSTPILQRHAAHSSQLDISPVPSNSQTAETYASSSDTGCNEPSQDAGLSCNAVLLNSETAETHDLGSDSGCNDPPQDAGTISRTLVNLQGRRLVDIGYLFTQLLNTRHMRGRPCSFSDCVLEKEHRSGFFSRWIFRCTKCQFTTKVVSDMVSADNLHVNDAAVTGAISGGGGYNTLSALAASLNMPCISHQSFIDHEKSLAQVLEAVSVDEMIQAGEVEKQLAIAAGDVGPDGIPNCPGIADGFWGKRSYKTKFDSLVGLGVIIGFRSMKVLFIGIRNKYCSICAIAERKGIQANPHKCYKNWNASSTSMEADIIAEGFHNSIAMHGLRITKLIADGDSSVHQRLLETMPYGPNMLVQKIECKNHVLRNCRNGLKAISEKTKDEQNYPVRLRKVLKEKYHRIVTGISKACEHWQNDTTLPTERQRIEALRKDILNAAAHNFGQHDKCCKYFCDGPEAHRDEVNLVPEMQKCKIWSDIMHRLNLVADKADSLILNLKNNAAECLNNVVAKYLGGKRVNYAQRNSFHSRSYSAVVSLNSSGELNRKLHKAMKNGFSPGIFTKRFESSGRRKRHNLRQRRKDKPRRKTFRVVGADKDYGDVGQVEDPDAEGDSLDVKKAAFLETLNLTAEERKTLQEDTKGQSDNPRWMPERRKRLGSSHHGEVCHQKKTTKRSRLVHKIIYGGYGKTKAMARGSELESEARAKLISKGYEVQTCGMFIDDKHPFLSSSPDGIIDDEVLVEIKCPDEEEMQKYADVQEAVSAGKLKFLEIRNGEVHLRYSSNYFCQVQSQLMIAKRKRCVFYVFTKNWDFTEIIEKNEQFWKEEMEEKLVRFYMDCLLPELASPLYGLRRRIDDIREPQYVLDAIAAKAADTTQQKRRATAARGGTKESAIAPSTPEVDSPGAPEPVDAPAPSRSTPATPLARVAPDLLSASTPTSSRTLRRRCLGMAETRRVARRDQPPTATATAAAARPRQTGAKTLGVARSRRTRSTSSTAPARKRSK